MSPKEVARGPTEEAIRLLRLTNADCRLLAVESHSHGRIIRTSSALGSGGMLDARLESYYLRSVSIAEAYSDVLMSELISQRLGARDEIVLRLKASVETSSSRDWQSREATFRELHGINLQRFKRKEQFASVRRVRNIIAHGLGRVTSIENKAGLPLKLATVKVAIRDGKIYLTMESVDYLTQLLIEYARWLDIQSQDVTHRSMS